MEGLMITPIGQRLIERGVAQGRESERRDAVLDALDRRFRLLPVAVKERLARVEDLQQLKELFDSALSANSLDEFMQSLQLIIAK